MLPREEKGEAIAKANSTVVDPKQQELHVEPMHEDIPQHVLSIKCLSDYKRNFELNAPCLDPIPESMKTSYNAIPQHKDLGEYIPEPLRANKDLLLEEVRRFRLNAQQGTLTNAIRKALNDVEDEI